ncbi:BCCT family transporter [Haladaptatus sp. W1]|uniref:BCCT family transporter n=1 Tax=Haladaptatus sp. W1 TaxID=1897478 RepID=UPI0020C81392|nr:BCCT family transporter [Haladaptatus sp. W1]
MSQEQGIVREFVDEIDPLVFGFGILTAVTFLGYVLLVGPDQAGTTMEAINDWLWTNFSWFYLWAMLIFVGFTTFLIFGPWGKIKLGPPDAEPRHDFLSYFAMFFSAGIAAGIVFWGPAEAIFHYGSGTPLAGADAPRSNVCWGRSSTRSSTGASLRGRPTSSSASLSATSHTRRTRRSSSRP